VLDGEWIGLRAFWPSESGDNLDTATASALEDMACEGFEEQQSLTRAVCLEGDQTATVRVEWNAGRAGLFVFGAGDDAIPLVRQARQLGWYVAVADGRSNLATRARFPEAHDVHVLPGEEFPGLGLRPTDAAVVMTHSLQQDTRILSALLTEELAYIGVLGPRRRTDEILLSIAGEFDLPESRIDARVEMWMERLHAPMGLDLGGGTSADIALAVIAEIQQCRHRASGLALRVIRARDAERRRVTA
jgi:xanthine dehydrogenase accessory factor